MEPFPKIENEKHYECQWMTQNPNRIFVTHERIEPVKLKVSLTTFCFLRQLTNV